jgi:hypothetical protein
MADRSVLMVDRLELQTIASRCRFGHILQHRLHVVKPTITKEGANAGDF